MHYENRKQAILDNKDVETIITFKNGSALLINKNDKLETDFYVDGMGTKRVRLYIYCIDTEIIEARRHIEYVQIRYNGGWVKAYVDGFGSSSNGLSVGCTYETIFDKVTP